MDNDPQFGPASSGNFPPPPLPPSHAVPPVISTPRPPAPPRTGRGWKIAAIVFAGLLALNIIGGIKNRLVNALAHAKPVKTHGTSLEEVVVEDSDADSDYKIALLDIGGIITSSGEKSGMSQPDMIEEELKAAAKDKNVKAIILRVDSPGGEVLASDEIYNLIANFQQKNPGKPVIASMGGLAASGGYYVSAPCQYIVANELTITGSIGVIMHGYNYRGLMDKVGLVPEVYKSGRFKDMMSGEKELSDTDPEEKKMVQTMIDETYGKFKKVVAQGRALASQRNKGKGRTLASDWADYADGRILTAHQAFDLGLVDEVGDFKAAVKVAKDLAGISDASLIQYQLPFDFANLFRLLGKTEVPALKIDLGVDLPKMQAGRPYYLLPIAAH